MKVYYIQATSRLKRTINAHAQHQGESLNGFVNRAIDEAVERDNAKEASQDEQ